MAVKIIPQITFENHIKFGFDGKYDFQFRTNNSEAYDLSFTICSRKPLSFEQEAKKTARLIQRIANGEDIWVSYSGGIDSEFVVRTFLSEQIPIKIAINKFKYDLNEYDLYYARKFCADNNLKLYEFEVDIEKFLENELWEYASSTSTISPIFSSHMKLWDSLDGFIVGGHGDPIFKREEKTNNWFFQVKETEDSVYRYCVWKNRNAAPGFFSYTPEMLLSFLQEPEIMRLFLFGHVSRVSNIIGPKEEVYNRIYNLEHRKDATGFEKIMDLDNYYRDQLKTKLPTPGIFTKPLQEFIKSLWPKCMTIEGGARYLP